MISAFETVAHAFHLLLPPPELAFLCLTPDRGLKFSDIISAPRYLLLRFGVVIRNSLNLVLLFVRLRQTDFNS